MGIGNTDKVAGAANLAVGEPDRIIIQSHFYAKHLS